jgi:hypothetical protein
MQGRIHHRSKNCEQYFVLEAEVKAVVVEEELWHLSFLFLAPKIALVRVAHDHEAGETEEQGPRNLLEKSCFYQRLKVDLSYAEATRLTSCAEGKSFNALNSIKSGQKRKYSNTSEMLSILCLMILGKVSVPKC